jgi:hypothetical protein
LAWLNSIPDKYDYPSRNYYRPLLRYDFPPTWEQVYLSALYRNALDDELRDYERKLRGINDMEMFSLKLKVQQLIDDLKRAKED